MRVFGPIVFAQPLFMRADQSQTPKRRGVGAKLVGDQQLRRKSLLLEKLAHQPQRGSAVAPALNQHVEDLTFVIDSTPKVHPLAGDPHHQASGAVESHRRALAGRVEDWRAGLG